MRCTKRVCGTITTHLGIIGMLCLAAGMANAAPSPQKFVNDELLVQFKAGAHKAGSDSVLKGAGAAEAEEIPQLRIKRIKVPAAARDKVKAALAKNPNVSFVEENYLAEPTTIPNDPSFASQWHLPKIAAPAGWDISTGSSTVDIAIIDTGIDPSHPDLAGKLLPGYNFVTNTTDTHDVYGHGTKVAGSAAAMVNNAVGVSGVAWQNPILPLAVTDSTGIASYSRIASAITYAVDHGARIINISFAGPTNSTTMQSAIDYAWNKGAIIFAGAGNSATNAPYYPAACNHVVAVAATTSSDTLASFSNYGNWITVAAPGYSILTTTNGGGYGSVSGTSFSGPITAGLGALILSVNPTLSNAQVVDIITKNTDDIGAPGFDPSFGNGRINVLKSLTAAQNAVAQSDTTAPLTSITSPTSASTVKGKASVAVAAADNVGVAKVELHINGSPFATATTAPFFFSWDTTTTADGTYTLEAMAYDGAGNTGRSGSVSVKVANAVDTIAPTVAITSPANGAKIGTSATISIAASDNVGVSRIELHIDGKLVTSKTGLTNLSYAWNTRKITTGAHTVTAKAFDAGGNAATTSITVHK
ncbi:serine protease [Planctomycetaceae bacterium]|nr:serine protease [Planctomycetaceae bacterium]